MGWQFSQALSSLPTKTDLEQAKCEIIERNEVMQKQQRDELLEKIEELNTSPLQKSKFLYKTNNSLLYIFLILQLAE